MLFNIAFATLLVSVGETRDVALNLFGFARNNLYTCVSSGTCSLLLEVGLPDGQQA